ncbi:MAG: hypothetical protein PHE49_08990 [bacterium]|nr:hypothetical protein [bacterium]
MKKNYNTVTVVILLLSILPCVYASSNSPWGVNAVWDASLPFTSPGNANDKCKDYNKQLDSLLSGGFSWIRPANMPGCESQANDFRFDQQDSIVSFANRRNLNLMFVVWPFKNFYPTLSDSIQNYWRYQVERYDKDGKGYGKIPEMPGLTKPVKYWEICNEPNYWHRHIYRPDANTYEAFDVAPESLSDTFRVVYYSTHNDTFWMCDSAHCKNFLLCDSLCRTILSSLYKYIKISSIAIKSADRNAKIVAPSYPTFIPAAPGWTLTGLLKRKDLKGNYCSYFEILYKSPEFWWGDLLDSVGKYIDVISFHAYSPPAEILSQIDTLTAIFNRHNAKNKPMFITETGWVIPTDGVDRQGQALYYKQLCEGLNQRKNWANGKNKIFLFTLKDIGADSSGLLDANFARRPAFDTLQNFIFSHSGKMRSQKR